jgi:hypothetical protein
MLVKNFGSGEMFKNLNVHGDFTPATWASPDAITPEKVITAVSHSAGAVRGDRHCPLLQNMCPFISYDDQRNSTEPKHSF